jgi:hypothetical protein
MIAISATERNVKSETGKPFQNLIKALQRKPLAAFTGDTSALTNLNS